MIGAGERLIQEQTSLHNTLKQSIKPSGQVYDANAVAKQQKSVMHAHIMSIKRIFLGWDQPFLHSAADYLVQISRTDRFLDMRQLIVVVPGSRAGRRLLEIFVEKSEGLSLPLLCPEIVTVGSLPERLYQPAQRFAESLMRRLAWMDTIQSAPKELLASLMPDVPEGRDDSWCLVLARHIESLAKELSSASFRFADVPVRARTLSEFGEASRWLALDQLYRLYLARLADCGLSDKQEERLQALFRNQMRSSRDIILVACADLSPFLRGVLRQVEGRVSALVFAPEKDEALFDACGCLNTEAWLEKDLRVSEVLAAVAEGPAAQAAEVIKAVASFGEDVDPQELSIGIADHELQPHIAQALSSQGIAARVLPGLLVRNSAPARLLASVSRYLGGKRFGDLASLVRHPDLQQWLCSEDCPGLPADSLLQILDLYHTQHLPLVVDAEDGTSCSAVCRVIDNLLCDLRGPCRPLSLWAQPLAQLLAAIYGGKSLKQYVVEERDLTEALIVFRDALDEVLSLAGTLAPYVDARQAIVLLLDAVSDKVIPPAQDERAVEILDWLELALDDAPNLVISGMNEGIVPSSVTADPFLPNSLRRELGLLDNDRRYARDAYALFSMSRSKEKLRLILGKRNSAGETLLPTRLLLTGKGPLLAAQVRFFYGGEVSSSLARTRKPSSSEAAAIVGEPPRPLPLAEPVTEMSVTAFRDYLLCPYRFYLKHVLKLRVLDDSAPEMDARVFGNLAHAVLAEFAQSSAVRSSDDSLISRTLLSILDSLAKSSYGTMPLPAVLVQLKQLQSRLVAFSRWQADWVSQGWRVEKAEVAFSGTQCSLLLDDGECMAVKGRIDRLDRNEKTGEWAIIDYKTSEDAVWPEEAHRVKGEWKDLQLPLYVKALERQIPIASVKTGYLSLCRDLRKLGGYWAAWGGDDYLSAQAKACEIAAAVRAQVFWPPRADIAGADEFAAICGVGFLREEKGEEGEVE